MAKANDVLEFSSIDVKSINKFLSLVNQRFVQQAMSTFLELDVPDTMMKNAKAMSAKEICQCNGNNWNAEGLYRLMRVLTDLDIVRTINENENEILEADHPEELALFELTADGQLLTKDHPSKIRSFILFHFHPYIHSLSEYLPIRINNDNSKKTSFGENSSVQFFEFIEKEENKQFAGYFHDCMLVYTNIEVDSIKPVLDLSSFKTLVDIGGGLGVLIAALLAQTPNLHGILFDLPRAIDQVKSNPQNAFHQRNIDPKRYEIVGGDMFKPETIPKADSYILKHIIHDWSDENCIKILQAIRSANQQDKNKKIHIFIVEKVILHNGKDSFDVHIFDLIMLILGDAKERTVKQYSDLLQKSGFQFEKLHKTNTSISIIEAVTII